MKKLCIVLILLATSNIIQAGNDFGPETMDVSNAHNIWYWLGLGLLVILLIRFIQRLKKEKEEKNPEEYLE